MSKLQEHNLRNIQDIFEEKTGTHLKDGGHACRRPISRVALVAAVLAVCAMLAAFTYPLFSPLDGDALTLSATYAGNGIVSIEVQNHSYKPLEFQPQTKLVKWITGEEVTPLSDDIAFGDLTVGPHSTKTITLDLSKAYDMELLEQSFVTEWYYLVLTNYNFVFGQEWKCSVYFGDQQNENLGADGVLYEIDPVILSRIDEALRFYFEDDYYGIFAANPLHYEYLQTAQELLQRSGKKVLGTVDPMLIIEPVKDGVILDENYPPERQYALDLQHSTLRDVFGKLVGFTEDQHVIKLGVATENGWELPIMYFATYERYEVEKGGCYAFIYGQLVSFEELQEHLVYEDSSFCCYDVTHLFYTDLRGYFEEVVASDPGYYKNAGQYWQRIRNVYNYYQENLKILSFEEWTEGCPNAHVENYTSYENLTTEGLTGILTANRDMEKIVIDICAENGEELYAVTIVPSDPRYYDFADIPEVSEVLKNLPDGRYFMHATVWLSDTDYMSCQRVMGYWFCAGEATYP